MIALFDKIETAWFDMKYGVENCIKWLPIVWKDRDWDDYSLYKIMEFKFNKMSRLHLEDGHSADSDKISNQLKAASELCHKLADYDYDEDAMYDFKQKYPEFELEMTFTPAENGCSIAHFNTDDLPFEDQELYSKHFKIAEELEKKDRHELFQLIENNITDWCD